MEPWIIIILALWIYPIITYFVIRLTKNNFRIRKDIFIYSSVIFGLTILGLAFNISTINSDIDWIFVTSVYFFLLLILWWTQFQLIQSIKFIGSILLIGV